MSMISSLIDELNKSADEWNGSNMFELARMCREAADTITELRGALQVASVDYRQLAAESARLRERYEEYEQKMDGLVDVLTGGLLSKSAGTPNEFIEDAASEHLTKDLAEENARLRELASVLWYCMQDRKDCDGCRLNGAEGELSYDPLCACDGLHEMMRELGVGVDG